MLTYVWLEFSDLFNQIASQHSFGTIYVMFQLHAPVSFDQFDGLLPGLEGRFVGSSRNQI